MHDPVEVVEEAKNLIASRRRRPVSPSTGDEPEPLIIEEASPSVVMADVLGDLELEEVVESQLGAEGETRDTKVLLLTLGRMRSF